MTAPPKVVLITGAAGQIGYALAPLVCRGAMFGPDQPIILHLLDIAPAAAALGGVAMELCDAAYPLVMGIVHTVDVDVACVGVDVAVMVGGFPRGPGMERAEVMGKNVAIYKAQASSLEKHANAACKVVVVANPANTNALILSKYAPKIPKENVTCLTRLDHNRALGQVAQKANVPVRDVKNVIIWGNHSSTQFPDVNHGSVCDEPIRNAINDETYLNDEFVATVQQRGAAIIAARKLSSAMSAASSVCDHVRDWVLGTPPGVWTSMGVISPGGKEAYGIAEGLMYSFPVTCADGKWQIVQGLEIDARSRKLMTATETELAAEKSEAEELIASM
jgi:malate dehydrogenase